MDHSPTILELVSNGTMSAEMAATLWAAMDEQRSFVVAAIPRLAGKTTVSNAMLGMLPPDIPVHRLSGDEDEVTRLKREATGGYLVVGEFSQGPMPNYIWGRPVRQVFDALASGYSLATALHAPGLFETFDVICQGNGVTDEEASRIDLMVYIRRFGDGPASFWRRITEIHEVDHVESGHPHGRLLHRWIEDKDTFETVERPQLIHADHSDLSKRAALLKRMAESGETTTENVAHMIARNGGPSAL